MDAQPAPVDLTVLAGQTGGDKTLEREVLGLFLTRSAADLERLKAAAPGEAQSRVAHGIAGTARAIGAGRLARLAAAVERDASAGRRRLAELEAELVEARRFVSRYLSD